MSKDQWLIPNSQGQEPDTEWLYQHNHYFGTTHCHFMDRDTIAKLFASKYAYAEKVYWPKWRASKFYGPDEQGFPMANSGDERIDCYVLITIYGAIGKVEPCPECGIIYRYLDVADLKYKCDCQFAS